MLYIVNILAPASPARSPLGVVREESHSAGASFDTLDPESRPDNRSNCVSPASSNGGVYSVRRRIIQHENIHESRRSESVIEFRDLCLPQRERGVMCKLIINSQKKDTRYFW